MLQSAIPGALTNYTMPTQLERNGDFSQSPVQIKSPNGVAYPNNRVPVSDLNPNGLALLNTLPLPNFTNTAISGGNYNYQIQETLRNPSAANYSRSITFLRKKIASMFAARLGSLSRKATPSPPGPRLSDSSVNVTASRNPELAPAGLTFSPRRL